MRGPSLRTWPVVGMLVAAAGCQVQLAPLNPQDLKIAISPAPSGPVAVPSALPTATPSGQPTPHATASAEPTPSPSPTVAPTATPSAAPTPTPTPEPTPTPTGTIVVGASPESSGAWSSITALARPRMGHVAMALDSRLLVAGGVPSEVLEGYRPAGDAWDEQDMRAAYVDAKRLTILGQYFACGGAIGTGRIVLAGGFDGASEIAVPRVYTLGDAFQFTAFFGAAMPTPRYSVAGTTIGNRLYVAGGLRTRRVVLDGVYRTADTVASLESYDGTANSWTAHPSVPYAVSSATAVALNGQLVVVGGMLSSGEPTSEVQVFRPDINQWTADPTLGAVPPMLTPRHSAAAAVLNGKLYVVGGIGEGRAILSAGEVYDPATRTWQALPPMPFARYLHAAAALGNRIYVLGGNNAAGQPQRTVEAFTP